MSESRYLMRTIGGPFPGDRVSPGPWPLPDSLSVPGEDGAYVKVRESQLTDDLPGVMRGAEYEWHKEPDRE